MDKLHQAIAIVGSQAKMARKLNDIFPDANITPQHIWNWLHRDKCVPPEYCPSIEALANKEVTRLDLRPADGCHIWPELNNSTNPTELV